MPFLLDIGDLFYDKLESMIYSCEKNEDTEG